MIQRPDKYAHDLFAFAISIDKTIHKQ